MKRSNGNQCCSTALSLSSPKFRQSLHSGFVLSNAKVTKVNPKRQLGRAQLFKGVLRVPISMHRFCDGTWAIEAARDNQPALAYIIRRQSSLNCDFSFLFFLLFDFFIGCSIQTLIAILT